MPRRVSLPGASELFRTTHSPALDTPAAPAPTPEPQPGREAEEPAGRGSGRVRHDEKITVYVSSDELMALEQARLTLRARHGLRVDRGRLVREAIARLVSDLEENGADSEVVRRMTGP